MDVNPLGPAAALAAFFSIWFGHVAVRKIESISPALWVPMTAFAAAGIVLEAGSLLVQSRVLAAVLGIIGMTFLFDAFELIRQQRRVRKGHAPANPRNPRHARILAEYAAATPVDVLKREPVGRPVSSEEAANLVSH